MMHRYNVVVVYQRGGSMSENGREAGHDVALVGALNARMLDPAHRIGYELPVIGTSTAPQGEFLWQAPTEQWWLFNGHRDDPTAVQYGGVVVPPDVKERLTRLLTEGFAPDVILIGHEMPHGWGPGSPLPDLVPTPPSRLPGRPRRSTAAGSPTASHTSRNVGVGVLKLGKAVVLGGVAVGVALGAAVGAVSAAAARLDPVIVAGVRNPGTGLVTWVEVARWDW